MPQFLIVIVIVIREKGELILQICNFINFILLQSVDNPAAHRSPLYFQESNNHSKQQHLMAINRANAEQ